MQDQDFVLFKLDSLVMAIQTAEVRSVERSVFISPLPEAPAPVIGIVNYAGEPVPVIDIRKRMGLQSREVQIDDFFLFTSRHKQPLALVIDEVCGVFPIPSSDLSKAEVIWPGLTLLSSISGHDGKIILVQKLDGLLDEQQEGELFSALRKSSLFEVETDKPA